MSIVNQVLNELEKRGVNAALGEAQIRSVAPRRQSHKALYALLGGGLLIVLAVAAWYAGRAKSAVPDKAVAGIASSAARAPSGPAAAIVSAPVEAETAGASGVPLVPPSFDSLRGKPLLEVQSEEGPVAGPEVNKAVRRKAQRAPAPVAEDTESLPIENLEQLKTISPQQRAENEFVKANRAVQEGRTNDALAGYKEALLADPTYKPARRAWVGLLVSLKQNNEAEQVLYRGLRHDPRDAAFAMMLARLQVERDDVPLALETLQKTLPYAEGQADFQSFVAALMQRLGRHDEAVAHYQIALKLTPDKGLWLMGMGISLQALQRREEARDAYQRALASNTLSPQLQAYVQQKLNEL
ncbi:MAG: tetratricopeptide repeat protein [Gammaproteobacteria bacterium]|nr:tetratricopeptide repeat protein [Gammaproteobacteria bacterium]MBU1481545.1 tetratricopeptide repeat protein [Gammaproteobacteria bacterium]